MFYVSLRVMLNKKYSVFKTLGLCYYELIFCKLVNLQKPRS